MELRYFRNILETEYGPSFFNKNPEYRELAKQYTSFLNENAKLKQRVWHILHEVWHPVQCQVCDNNVNWDNRNNKYRNFCSVACSRTPDVINRIKETTTQRHGGIGLSVDKNYKLWKSKIDRNKDNILEKRKRTNLSRYGHSSYSQTDQWKEKVGKTSCDKYNVEWPSKSLQAKNAARKTNLNRYGVEHHTLLPDSVVKNYEVGEHPKQQHFTDEAKDILFNPRKLLDMSVRMSATEIANLIGVYPKTVCNYIYAHGGQVSRKPHSVFEKQVADYIRSHGIDVKTNDRELLNGKELDIFVPSLKLAIECNGTYWHSELQGKDKNYHIEKTEACESKGIQLIHIWQHTWDTKQEIVESRISNFLQKSCKLNARHSVVKVIKSSVAKEFLNRTHIQGSAPASINLGLFINDRLISVMTFSKPRFSDFDFELLRYSSVPGVTVRGGASKMFAVFKSLHPDSSVVSYADRMFSSNGFYKHLGFIHTHNSAPCYWYTKDYNTFYHRSKYQKHKLNNLLEDFDPDLTEWQNMKNNGYDRIWDCGNEIWAYNKRDIS